MMTPTLLVITAFWLRRPLLLLRLRLLRSLLLLLALLLRRALLIRTLRWSLIAA